MRDTKPPSDETPTMPHPQDGLDIVDNGPVVPRRDTALSGGLASGTLVADEVVGQHPAHDDTGRSLTQGSLLEPPSHRPPSPLQDNEANASDLVAEYIAALLASRTFGRQVRHHRVIPQREAQTAPQHRPWTRAVQDILTRQGIADLYSHQARATDIIRAGRDVVVATPTASGKTFIYNLPVLEQFLRDPDARAIYLFPLKALAQDQLATFNALTAHWPRDARPAAAIYDGDTTDHFRRKIRNAPPPVLLTNPEMLHLALLPHHEQWASLFASLTHVVVDEVHTYRGVLGAHMAQVFRRLRRVCERYGAQPSFVFCSATVGNPGELAHNLTGLTPEVVTESGAPQGKRHFIFLDPEESPATAAIQLLRSALKRGLRTIVYCQSRRMTELVSLWAAEKSGPYRDRISAYRAGFLPEERRDVEARMASGQLLAVITTSALELGIDIGSLDLCILVGYPGTVMSTLQRGGRVGRARQESAVVLVAGEDALDQYFMRHPEDFFARGAEHAVLNPDNPVILARHLECAAAEIPLSAADPWLASPGASEAVQRLEREGLLLRSADGSTLLASRKRPQRHVDLCGSGSTYTIEDGEGHIIGSVDGHRALRETHPGAVYLHRGRTWVVQQLDPGARKVMASPARVGWYTRVRGNKQTEILDVQDRREAWGTRVFFGRLRVTETVTGYEKRSASGGRLLGVTPLDLPPTVFETEGLWFEIPDAAREATERELLHFMGSIHALEHAAIGILPLLVMTDRNDLGGISTPMHPQVGRPAVFIYDGMPGGAALSRLAFARADELFARTRDAIGDCPCETGCPSCVHSPKCGSGNRPIDKAGALFLLDRMAAGTPERDDGPSLHAVMPSDGVPLLPTEEHGVHDKQPEGAPPETARDGSRPAGDRGCIMPASYDAASISPSHPDDDTRQENTMNATYTATTPDGVSVASSAMAPPEKASPASSCTVAAERKSAPRVMVLDVETRRSAAEVGGWHRADRMGVSIAVLHDSGDDSFTAYPQDEVPAMLHRLREADLVVGFNIVRFDYTVLSPFAPFDLHTLPTLDMLQKVKDRLSYRVSLDNLAQATLNAPKSADGLQALRWWQEGRLDLIAEYCRKDVELTRDLYLYGLANGYLLFTNKAGQTVRVPVEW